MGAANNRRGSLTIPLIPSSSNQMFGRSGFLIHGDNSCGCDSASEGCVILPRWVRELLNDSDDREFRVVQ